MVSAIVAVHSCILPRRFIIAFCILIAQAFNWSVAGIAACVPALDPALPRDTTDTIPVAHIVDPDTSRADAGRVVAVSLAGVGGFVYGHVLSTDLWWKGEPSSFHFDWEHDWTYALGADKLGHAFFPYAASRLFAEAFQWCGYSSSTSRWIGSSIALAYQTYTEIRDGFSAAWGFSWGDMGANVVGAALPILQDKIPSLKHYAFKISFHPSARFKEGSNRAIIDDYESTYHWVSCDVGGIVPESWNLAWPRWLNLAIGHSVKDLDDRGAGRHEIYLSLDLNFEGLPGEGWFWNLMKRTLNVYHFPAPAVRVVGGAAFFVVRI